MIKVSSDCVEKNHAYAELLFAAIYISPDEEREYTFCQVRADARKFGASLVSSWKWRKGDALSLFLFNSIDTPALIWGCHWAGGVVVPSSPTCTAREYAFQLMNSRAKAIVTSESLLHTAVDAAWIARIPKERIMVVDDGTIGDSYFIRLPDMLQQSMPDAVFERSVKLDPATDYAFLCYTSGTTGLSKAVGLTHTNIIANVLQNRACDAEYLTWNGGTAAGHADRIMAFLPFYHIYGTFNRRISAFRMTTKTCAQRSTCSRSHPHVRRTHRCCDAKIRFEEVL